MSQVSGRPCPACGTMVPAGQRFCSNCGTDMTVSGQASQYGAGLQPQNVPPAQQVPPYAQAPGAFGQQQQQVPPYAQAPGAFGQQPQQKSNPIAEALAALGLLFFLRRYRPGYAARRQSSGCCGCLVVLVIFGAIFGIPGYLYYRANANTVNCGLHLSSCRTAASSTTTTVTNTATTATSTTTAHIITATINQKVTYAGVDITIINVQQATSFSDDNPNANGVVRVNINEANNSSSNANYFFSDSAHLILPDGSKIALTHDLQDIGIQSSTTRNNWLDFAVPTSDKINQLTLVLGTDKEAQIIIPLTGNANLSAYQLKMVTPNKPITYWGLNWTLQKATSSLSFGGTQAPTGMRYIVLTFNVDNPSTANVTIGFTDEYMRLKSGTIMNPSTNTTLPLGINASTTGVNGTVTFLMPGNDTAFTLIFLSKQGGINPQPNPQVNTDFTIP